MLQGRNEKSSANNQQQMLAARTEWEIRQMIFPHIQRQKDCRYPFSSEDELVKAYYRHHMQAAMDLKAIFEATPNMPPGYGDAFGYIAMREIAAVIGAFAELAKSRPQSIAREPREPVVAG
jgi:hypothetical protein